LKRIGIHPNQLRGKFSPKNTAMLASNLHKFGQEGSASKANFEGNIMGLSARLIATALSLTMLVAVSDLP
jgi:hypothetical protein